MTVVLRLPIVLLILVTGFCGIAHAQQDRPPVLDFPVKCTIGLDCEIQHYVDLLEGPAAADLKCGSLTYDRHTGTDIRIRSLKQMEKGVPVVAAADGEVFNLRKGVPDQYFSDYSKAKQREVYAKGLGNVVVLHHGKGWNTFYAHLKKDSIVVNKGQRVSKGQILGYIGMSGLTDFPHLHFELRHKKARLDPFTGLEKSTECGTVDHTYWSEAALAQMPYKPTFFVNTGFSEQRPEDRKDLETGQKRQEELDLRAPTLFFWTYYIGGQKGDKVTIDLMDPSGNLLKTHTTKPMGKNQISRMLFLGVKKPDQGWVSGTYRGKVKIKRLTGEAFEDSAQILVQ